MSSSYTVMKRILLLTLLFSFPFYALVISAVPPPKVAKPVPDKEVGPKKKYSFIGKLLEKEKVEPEEQDDDKQEGAKKGGDKKGKKNKKGGRTHLLKFQVKEVIDGKDDLKPNLVLICVVEPGQARNPNQVKGGKTEPGETYRVVSTKKELGEDKVLRLSNCRLFSAKGRVGEEFAIGKAWNGTLPVKSLDILPEDQRKSPVAYLGDNKAFTAFMESFKSFDEKVAVPPIDFSKNIVVLVKNVRHPEPIIGIKGRLDEGTLRVAPKKDFDFEGRILKGQIFASFFVLPRKGITTISSGKSHEFEIKPPGFIYAD